MRKTILAATLSGVFFLVLAVVAMRSTAPRLDAVIPLGTEQVATVPLFNLWTLAWNVDRLGDAYSGYWQAPIFHPAPDAFALSEPQPLTGLFAAVLTMIFGSVLAAYNVILIGSLALNGWIAALALRAAGLSPVPALAGGVLVLVLPFTHQELGVLQLVPLVGVFAITVAVVRFAEAPKPLNGLWLGLAAAAAYCISAQTAVFGVLALAPAALWLWRSHRSDRRAWGSLVAAGLAFLVFTAPILPAQVRATSAESFERSAETVKKRSARVDYYLTAPWPTSTPSPEVAEKPSDRAFWPGALRIALALGAIAFGLRDSRWRRFTIAATITLVAAFLLSLGGNLQVGERSVADLLRLIPGMSQIRNFFRFALFVQLAVAVLAALGLELLQGAVRRRRSAREALLAVGVLALAAGLEMRPAASPVQDLPSLDLELPWLEWIEESTEPDDVLAFVPFPKGRSSSDYLGSSQWMYWQIRHWRPMVNGYSGFFPSRFRSLKKKMQDFPSEESLQALHESGVDYCIVPTAFLQGATEPDGPLRLKLELHDEEFAIVVFRLIEAEADEASSADG